MKLQIGIDGKSYEVEVEVAEDDELPHLHIYGAYPIVPTTVQSSAGLAVPRQAQVAEEEVNEATVCRSPVDGIVTKVSVQPGQEIKANDLLMVLEAMKMETNITTALAGKVKSVRVNVGDAVKRNQVVVDLE